MFKALAQRIARYVLRDELSSYETECTKLQDELRKELHEVKHDNAALVQIMHELRMEIDMLNGYSHAEW